MRLRTLVTATAVLGLAVASFGITPAHAASVMTISANPTSLKPGETTTVSGSTSGPACADDGVAVTLTYTDPDGNNDTVVVNTTTDASGAFTVPVVLADDAVAGEPANVRAVIADCTDDANSTVTSNVVALTVTAHTGTLTVTDESGAAAASGESGETVTVSGTNCYGGEVLVLFTDGTNEEEVDVDLLPDRTFSGDYVLPDAPGGSYSFVAQCPGTDYNVRAFQLRNEEPGEPLAPRPVDGVANFTG